MAPDCCVECDRPRDGARLRCSEHDRALFAALVVKNHERSRKPRRRIAPTRPDPASQAA